MTRGRSAAWGLAALLALATAPSMAHAQADLFSRESVSGVVDLRVGAADGEPSWTDDRFGKARFGDEAAVTAQADLVWRPRFNWEWSAMVDVQAQPDQTSGVDLGEAFIRYKPLPRGDTKWSARAGLFYPPISLEHSGGAWLPLDTITPSAINSWLGEELKVVGLEGSISHAFAGQEVSATAAVFYYGDTAGTLLSFRGWAMHDLKSSLNQKYPLPRLSAFMATKQAPWTTPVHEIDGLAGWYGRLEWAAGPVRFAAFYYDNGGDRTSKDVHKEWSWDTRFWAASALWTVDERTTVRAQAMRGVTFMGFSTPAIWIDAGYSAAYASITRTVGDTALTARLDGFEVTDHSWRIADPNREHGWALTAAVRHPLNDHADLFIEGMHISSDTQARARMGISADQGQTVVQSALRLKF